MKTLAQLADTARAGEFQLAPDGRCHLIPQGEFPNSQSDVVQVIDPPALRSILVNFTKVKSQPDWPGLLVDFDHFSYDADKESRAAGWIENLEARPNGLWASIRWTTEGGKAVAGGGYRFLSPVFDARDCQNLGGKRVRPLRLESAGLTNQPCMKTLTALTNRAALSRLSDPAAKRAEIPSPGDSEARAEFDRRVTQKLMSKRWTFQQAYNQVRLEKPALFAAAWGRG